jgi:small subunit ribosomal protein S29e
VDGLNKNRAVRRAVCRGGSSVTARRGRNRRIRDLVGVGVRNNMKLGLIININIIFTTMPNLLWRTHSRKFGKDSRECRRCKCQIGLVRKYDLLLCRKCFRENAEIIGFTKTR